jgi:transposase-like protein
VTYKTAWRMFKQIRSMMTDYPGPLSGEVEVDETYVGGKRSGGKTGRGAPGKTVILGIVERKGAVVAHAVPDVKRETPMPLIREAVPFTSTKVYTDELAVYEQLHWDGYRHETIKYGDKKYVRGLVHTNTVEGFWSLVKGGIRGVYRAVRPKYLKSYVNEYAFRYNRRSQERSMFFSLLGRVRKA